MYSYKIRKHKVTPDTTEPFLTKAEILKRNLEKCSMFRVGDYVRFKKPRNRKVYGHIVAIEESEDKVVWAHGGKVPMNIVIDVEKVDHANNIKYGVERVKTNVKKIVLVEHAKNV